jgi:serine/threonine protein kinase
MKCPWCGSLNPTDATACMRCHAHLATPSVIQLGQIIGRQYRVERFVGSGAVGQVYAGLDVGLNRPVALKVMSSDLLRHPTARARMEKEAKILARLHHPNVVEIHAVVDHQGVPVLALELITGGTLADRIERGPLPVPQALRLMRQLLAGMDAIHAADIVHRDIKPGNILLANNDLPKIADLGIAHDAGATRITKTGSHPGTPAYMSPEQVRGETISPRTDVYACGIVLYEMLTGRLPFDATAEFDMLRAHVDTPPDLSRLPSNTPSHIVAAIGRALAKDPRQRWASAREFADALEHAPAVPRPTPYVSTPHPPIPAPPDRPVPPPSPLPRIVGGVVLVGLLVFGLMNLLASKNETTAKPAILPTPPQPTKTPVFLPTPPQPTKTPVFLPTPPQPTKTRGVICKNNMVGIPAGSIGDISVSSFCIDQTEVTTRAYADCVASGSCAPATTVWRSNLSKLDAEAQERAVAGERKLCNANAPDRGDHPVNCVNWDQAVVYCQWAGKRLPEQSEWEYVARNPSKETKYPWGDEEPSDDLVCFRGGQIPRNHTCPAMFGRASKEFHVYGMAGNVWEWTATSAQKRSDCASRRINRGGSWYTPSDNGGGPETFEGAIRGSSGGCEESAGTMIGFRCVSTPL